MESFELDREELCSILSLYHLDGLEDFGELNPGAPSRVYWVRVDGRRFLLRLSNKRRFRDMVFERDLLAHLRKASLPVPRVVENVASGAFTPWTTRGRYVSLFEDIVGRRLGVFELRAKHAGAIGEFLARMHLASDGFAGTKNNEHDLSHLEELSLRAERSLATPRVALACGPDILRLASEIKAQQRRSPKGTRGIVHSDLFVGSVRFRAERLSGVMELENACIDRFNWDLAVAINAWCWEPAAHQAGGPSGAFSRAKLRALLDAYTEVRPLPQVDRAELAADLRLIALRFALTRLVEFELKRPAPGKPYRDYRHFLARLDVLAAPAGERLIEACAA